MLENGAQLGVRMAGGNLLINKTLTLSTIPGDDLNVGGDWTQINSAAFTHRSRLVHFNNTTATQTITVTGGGTVTYGFLRINKQSQSLVLAGAPNPTGILLNGSPTATVPVTTLDFLGGNFDLNQQTFTFYSWNGTNGGNQHKIFISGPGAGNYTRDIKSTTGPAIFSVLNQAGGNHSVLIERLTAAEYK